MKSLIKTILIIFGTIQIIIFGMFAEKWHIQATGWLYSYPPRAEKWEVLLAFLCLFTGLTILFFLLIYKKELDK